MEGGFTDIGFVEKVIAEGIGADLFCSCGFQSMNDLIDNARVVGGQYSDAIAYLKCKVGPIDIKHYMIGPLRRGWACEEGSLFDSGMIGVGFRIHFYGQLQTRWLEWEKREFISMRVLFLIGLCIILNGCNHGDSYHRGYVISKSIEPITEPEAESE